MTDTIRGLLDFLDRSPTPFHATANLSRALQNAGFVALDEGEAWQLAANTGYVVTRNDSSIIAFHTGSRPALEAGIRMIGAHTDSPCLKLKPNASYAKQGYRQLGVETYGGVLQRSWFDRDLTLAGRVSVACSNGEIRQVLINFQRPIACVPSLAIHLDREINQGRALNAQKELPLLLGDKDIDFSELVIEQIKAEHPALDLEKILDWEISAADTQAAQVIGVRGEFIASARLDNLLSCYVGLEALLNADKTQPLLLVCTDHEEIGSQSCCGAQGPFLESVLRRWLGDEETYARAIHKSVLISADNAHGVHPNYPEKHDEHHGPMLNAGPVIKINANQRYASTDVTQSFFRQLCSQVDVPVQQFVARADMGCGSTIGPITSSVVGVKTIDIGLPTFAMHSIRELAGSRDAELLVRAFTAFYQTQQLPC